MERGGTKGEEENESEKGIDRIWHPFAVGYEDSFVAETILLRAELTVRGREASRRRMRKKQQAHKQADVVAGDAFCLLDQCWTRLQYLRTHRLSCYVPFPSNKSAVAAR